MLVEGVCCLLMESFCHQEEVRICATTVFVDPYEEADAQVRKVQDWPWGACQASHVFTGREQEGTP